MPKKNLKRFFATLIILLFFFGVEYGYHRLTGDFRLSRIFYSLPHDERWAITLTSEHHHGLEPILNQDYTFFDHGHQSFAFISQDGSTILKFFKFHPFSYAWPLEWLKSFWSSPLTPEQELNRNKLKRVFVGYKLAYDLDKENCGLLFIHFTPTHVFNKKLRVYDRLGFSHEIDLDSTVFVIQKKARTTRHVLNEFLKKGDLETAKQRIGAIFDLYLAEYPKGLFDNDHNLIDNTGFIGEKAIRIDVGKLILTEKTKEKEFLKEDLHKIAYQRFGKWIKKYHPKYYEELMQTIEMKISAKL